jgi:hypothetical protein
METYKENNISLIVNYIIENYHKFILLIFVFVIIYFVDYISNINAIIYGSTQIPMVVNNAINEKTQKVKTKKNKNLK